MTKRSKKKILLIEDDPLMLRMYKRTFEVEGYKILLAESGEKGIEFTKKEKPDVILLDILMPGINGFEVLRRIQKDSQISNIPVIILSNLIDTDAMIAKTKQLGAKGYLVKSDYTPEEVLAQIEKATT